MHLTKTPREIRNNTREIKHDIHKILSFIRAKENTRFALYDCLGFELLLDETSLVDESIINTGKWEETQLEFIAGVIERLSAKSEVCFLDIGAYWGLYSMFALRAGASNVIAFEADKYNFSQFMAQQFLNNNVGEIECHNFAISDKKGTATFCDSRSHPDGNRGGVGITESSNESGTYEVQTVSIDEYLGLSDKVIVAKLDVEGHEPNVLSGMRETIASNRVLLQIEFLPVPKLVKDITAVLDSMSLREVKAIGVDRYYTNMSVEELGC